MVRVPRQSLIAIFLSFAVSTVAPARALIKPVSEPTTAPPISAEQSRGSNSFPNIPCEKYKLKNGLEVILSENHRLPLVSVNVWYHVGSANDSLGHTGLAHLVEHLMLNDSANRRYDYRKLLKAAGARSGSPNAYTDFHNTSFYETLPSSQIDLALKAECDRMESLLNALTQDELLKEQRVVRNERRKNSEQFVSDRMYEAEYSALFPKLHPYSAPRIGTHADIQSITLKEVQDFVRQYYRPNNATIAIVGDIDKPQLKIQLEKYFEAIPAGEEVSKIKAETPQIKNRKQVTVKGSIRRAMPLLGWLAPPPYDNNAEAPIVARILSGGPGSRLYRDLVVKDKIALDVMASVNEMPLNSVFTISILAKAGISSRSLEAAVSKVIAQFQKEGPTQNEIENARQILESRWFSQLERFGGKYGTADVLNRYNDATGNPDYLRNDIQRYERVTRTSAQEFANKYLNEKQCVVVSNSVGKEQMDDPINEAKGNSQMFGSSLIDTATSPASNPATGPSLNATSLSTSATLEPESALLSSTTVDLGGFNFRPQVLTLSNGLTVKLISRHDVPTLALYMVADGGIAVNPVDKAGVARLASKTAMMGTHEHSAFQFANDLDQNGISMSTDAAMDSSFFSAHCPSSRSAQLFDLLSDAILRPSFNVDEIKNGKELLTDSMPRAERILYRQVFGDSQAIGIRADGTTKSRKSISRTDLLNYWQNTFCPKNCVLTLSGDITLAQATDLAKKYFGEWKDRSTPVENHEQVVRPQGKIFLLNHNRASQATIVVGSAALSSRDPDYLAAQILNNILAGLSSGRLNTNLRSQRGYAYSVSSSMHCFSNTGVFLASTDVQTNFTADAVKQILGEIEQLHNGSISEREFLVAKNNLLLSKLGEFETNEDAARELAWLFHHGWLQEDDLEQYSRAVNAITLGDVQRAASKYFDPKKMLVVVVGDRTQNVPALRKLNLGVMMRTDYTGKILYQL